MKLPALKPKEVVGMLKKAGYFKVRQRGSHGNFSHPDRPTIVSVPIHNRDLKMGTLRGIIKQTGMEGKDFLKLR